MGIRKLNKFLVEKGLIDEYTSLVDYLKKCNCKNKRMYDPIIIGIDLSLYAHKFSYSKGDIILGFWNQIIMFLSNRILPLYIFDGKPPVEKSDILYKRSQKKQQYTGSGTKRHPTVTRYDYQKLRDFFTLLNIPYVNSNCEADFMCAKLYKDGFVTAILSEDTDLLALGCGQVIKFHKGKVFEYNLDKILYTLNLTYTEFVDFCILLGCDYLKSYNKLTAESVYANIRTNKLFDTSEDYEYMFKKVKI